MSRARLKEKTASGQPRPAAPEPRRAPASLTDQAYALLRREIVYCRLAPGSEVSETDLAERLKMSKTPVREALARLQFDGLVRTMPRRGYQITPVTIADVNELFDLRLILELGGLDLALERITPEEIAALEALAFSNGLDFLEAEMDFQDTVNFRFHTLLVRASGNERLYRLTVQHLTELERIQYLEAVAEQAYPDGPVPHTEIVARLKRGDGVGAREALRRHIEDSRQALLRDLTSRTARAPFQLA